MRFRWLAGEKRAESNSGLAATLVSVLTCKHCTSSLILCTPSRGHLLGRGGLVQVSVQLGMSLHFARYYHDFTTSSVSGARSQTGNSMST